VYWWGLTLIALSIPLRLVLLASVAWGHAMQSLFG
jgi:hypothetical protein